jgi:acyl-CoA synthetase (AMP-forming)/AMP-acid ligase II
MQVCESSGKAYTYLDIHDSSRGFGAGLQAELGLSPQDIVGIVLPNRPEFMIVFFGILDFGCVASPTNPAYNICRLRQVSLNELNS